MGHLGGRRVGRTRYARGRGAPCQRGTHVFRIRNGRVAYIHAYEDSEKVARAGEQMAALGISEAAAVPIIE